MQTIGDLTLTKYLDKGGFAEIFLSKKQGFKDIVATKRLDQNNLNKNPKLKKYLENEIDILNQLRHPNIIRIYEVIRKPDYIYIVMEYCDGGSLHNCLYSYIKKYKKPFTEEIVQYLMKQILSGLKCIHDHKIIHRDLKLGNILIRYNSENDKNNENIFAGQVKIIDFNASTRPGTDLAKTAIGTPINMAPSVIDNFIGNRDLYDEKVDIWSLGTLCYEMLFGKPLFDGSGYQIINKIKNSDINIPKTISPEAYSFLLCMLQKESEKRYSVDDLLRHEFITKNLNKTNYNNNYNPNNNNYTNSQNHNNYNNTNHNPNNVNYSQNNVNYNPNNKTNYNHNQTNYNHNNGNYNNNNTNHNHNNTNHNHNNPNYNHNNPNYSHNNPNYYSNNYNPNNSNYNPNNNVNYNNNNYNNYNQQQMSVQQQVPSMHTNNNYNYQNPPPMPNNQYNNIPNYNQYPSYQRYNTANVNYPPNQNPNMGIRTQNSQPIPIFQNQQYGNYGFNNYPPTQAAPTYNNQVSTSNNKNNKKKKKKKRKRKSSSSSGSSGSSSS